MPWTSSAKLTLNACAGIPGRGRDNVYVCDNSLNNRNYAYNNLQASIHLVSKYSKDSWHTSTETWYQYQSKRPM